MTTLKFIKMKFKIRLICLKRYSSGQSHFSEINVQLAEKNEFDTHFVHKCLEMRENEQTVVLNGSSEALGNCFQPILQQFPKSGFDTGVSL